MDLRFGLFVHYCMVMNNFAILYPGVPLLPVNICGGERYTEINEDDQKVWSWPGDEMYLPMRIETNVHQRKWKISVRQLVPARVGRFGSLSRGHPQLSGCCKEHEGESNA